MNENKIMNERMQCRIKICYKRWLMLKSLYPEQPQEGRNPIANPNEKNDIILEVDNNFIPIQGISCCLYSYYTCFKRLMAYITFISPSTICASFYRTFLTIFKT